MSITVKELNALSLHMKPQLLAKKPTVVSLE